MPPGTSSVSPAPGCFDLFTLFTVSPNYKIPANSFQPLNFRLSHSNDTTQ